MPEYEYGRIRVLRQKLEEAGIDAGTVERITEGGESIRKKDKPTKKSDWMRTAMELMDELLDEPTRRAVRESCACCTGGKRHQICKDIAASYETLEERIAEANRSPYVFGHSVTMEEDGRVLVRFAPEGEESYRCVCLPQAKTPISGTYCYCCGGHVKRHLQTALGRKLSCDLRSSALESGGTRTCSFLFTIED